MKQVDVDSGPVAPKRKRRSLWRRVLIANLIIGFILCFIPTAMSFVSLNTAVMVNASTYWLRLVYMVMLNQMLALPLACFIIIVFGGRRDK